MYTISLTNILINVIILLGTYNRNHEMRFAKHMDEITPKVMKQRYLHYLRNNGNRQTYYKMFDEDKCCAVGAMIESHKNTLEYFGKEMPKLKPGYELDYIVDHIEPDFELTFRDIVAIANMNDMQSSFKSIANTKAYEWGLD